MSVFRIGLVGAGKIVQDQHLAAIEATEGLELVAYADPHVSRDSVELTGVPGFVDLATMLDANPDIDAVAICTPANLRHRLAREAMARGKSVLLEKPPATTLAEVEDLKEYAVSEGRVLFAAWHSRFAPGIAQAHQWLAETQINSVAIHWHEDVHVWHPGQTWLWQAGGMGVFDPGINALSIVTHLLGEPFFLSRAELEVPANCQTPIAARLDYRLADFHLNPQRTISADFDFRHEDPSTWSMTFDTERGVLALENGGARLIINGEVVIDEPEREYQGVYAHFRDLLEQGVSDMDITPLRHVADALMLGHRHQVEEFIDA